MASNRNHLLTPDFRHEICIWNDHGYFFKSLVEKEITRETQAMNEFKALLNQV